MRYLSVCSGIEAATVAWHPLGWKPWAFSEIEKFPAAVLKHHYPEVPNLGDMTKFKEWPDGSIDLLVGGTPCQSFSIAGLRKGLDDLRGNLMLTYLAIARRYRPRWLVWENVPGVLSSNKGRDFGTFLGGLEELGYGFAYRILDAQYFGVPQRRRRVFVVGYLGDWRPPAAVLFERESLSGNPAPRREAGEGFTHDVVPCIGARGRGFERAGDTRGQDAVVAFHGSQDPDVSGEITHPIGRNGGREGCIAFQQNASGEVREGEVSFTLNQNSNPSGRNTPMVMASAQANAEIVRDGSPSLTCTHDGPPIAFMQNTLLFNARQDPIVGPQPIDNDGHTLGVYSQMQVRRLTPRECERLQGFPDGYTAIPWRGKEAEDCPDGPRYKALGNSMAVPVMRWLGKRIQMFESLQDCDERKE